MPDAANESPFTDRESARAAVRERVGLWARPGAGVFWAGVWLVYLVPAFVEAVDPRHSLVRQVGGLALLVAFVVSYLTWMTLAWAEGRGLGRREDGLPTPARWPVPMTPGRWRLTGVLVVLALACTLVVGEPGAAAIVFLAPVAASALEGREALLAIVACVVGVSLAETFAQQPPGQSASVASVVSTAFGCTMAGVITMGVRRMRGVMLELDEARAQAHQLATAEERVRIARDLHDLLGHSLTVISVRSQLAQRLSERGEHDRAAEEIGAVSELARTAMSDVRAAVSGYRTRPLAAELAAAEAALDGAGIAVHVERPTRPVPAGGEEALGFVVREGVTNVLRHARATSCAITVDWEGPALVVEVADDGNGSGQPIGEIDPEVGLPGRTDGSGNGLRGLAERVSAAGGRLSAGDRDGRFVLRAEVTG